MKALKNSGTFYDRPGDPRSQALRLTPDVNSSFLVVSTAPGCRCLIRQPPPSFQLVLASGTPEAYNHEGIQCGLCGCFTPSLSAQKAQEVHMAQTGLGRELSSSEVTLGRVAVSSQQWGGGGGEPPLLELPAFVLGTVKNERNEEHCGVGAGWRPRRLTPLTMGPVFQPSAKKEKSWAAQKSKGQGRLPFEGSWPPLHSATKHSAPLWAWAPYSGCTTGLMSLGVKDIPVTGSPTKLILSHTCVLIFEGGPHDG